MPPSGWVRVRPSSSRHAQAEEPPPPAAAEEATAAPASQNRAGVRFGAEVRGGSGTESDSDSGEELTHAHALPHSDSVQPVPGSRLRRYRVGTAVAARQQAVLSRPLPNVPESPRPRPLAVSVTTLPFPSASFSSSSMLAAHGGAGRGGGGGGGGEGVDPRARFRLAVENQARPFASLDSGGFAVGTGIGSSEWEAVDWNEQFQRATEAVRQVTHGAALVSAATKIAAYRRLSVVAREFVRVATLYGRGAHILLSLPPPPIDCLARLRSF